MLFVSSMRSSSEDRPVGTIDLTEKVLTKDVDAVLSVIKAEWDTAMQAEVVEKPSSDLHRQRVPTSAES